MKKLKILNDPKKIVFDVNGSLENIEDIQIFLKTLPHLFIITSKIYRISGSSDHGIEVTCPETTYEQVIILLEDFIENN